MHVQLLSKHVIIRNVLYVTKLLTLGSYEGDCVCVFKDSEGRVQFNTSSASKWKPSLNYFSTRCLSECTHITSLVMFAMCFRMRFNTVHTVHRGGPWYHYVAVVSAFIPYVHASPTLLDPCMHVCTYVYTFFSHFQLSSICASNSAHYWPTMVVNAIVMCAKYVCVYVQFCVCQYQECAS